MGGNRPGVVVEEEEEEEEEEEGQWLEARAGRRVGG